MAKKHRDPASEAAAADASPAAAIRSLFSADNPFRRRPPTEEPPAPPPPATAPRKRKRDEVEVEAGRGRRGGAGKEKQPGVGEKRKAPDAAAPGAGEDDEEAFDDEVKLLRTVFVGNLPLRTKRKVLTKEFAAFGEIESVRIRSVPLVDVSTTPLPVAFILICLV
jgi:nucleolar protein 12